MPITTSAPILSILAILTIVFIGSTLKAFLTKRTIWLAIAGISGVCATGLLGYISINLSQPASNRIETTDSRLFKSKENLTAVAGPLSWTETPLGPDDASLRVGNLMKGEFLSIISERKSDFADQFTLRNYAVAATDSLTDNLINTTQFELSEFKLNGMKALRNQVSGSRGDTTVDYFNTFVEGKEHFHQIRCWTPADRRVTNFPVLRKVANSFHEIPN